MPGRRWSRIPSCSRQLSARRREHSPRGAGGGGHDDVEDRMDPQNVESDNGV